MTEKNFYALFDKPTPQNLEANQRGRLTLEQQSALERTTKNRFLQIVIWGLMVWAVFVFLMIVFWILVSENGISSFQNLVISVGVIAVGLILFAIYIINDEVMLVSKDDIKNGKVESVIGKVVWTGRRYQVISNTRKLRSHQRGRALPPPGDYRFYCLPRSGVVVMAEELGLVPTKQANDLLLDVLERAVHFSMEDLDMNRQGFLSGKQKLRLLKDALWLGGVFLAFVGIAVIAQSQTANENLMVYVLFAVFAAVMLVRPGWGSINVIWDIWNGKVDRMDGSVARYARRTRNGNYYTYQLNGIKFSVSRSAYNALIEGREYRVYFAPHGKRLVAIEPI